MKHTLSLMTGIQGQESTSALSTIIIIIPKVCLRGVGFLSLRDVHFCRSVVPNSGYVGSL